VSESYIIEIGKEINEKITVNSIETILNSLEDKILAPNEKLLPFHHL